jgi:hypothetical protein
MRKITYKKLSGQNFLSIGNDTVEIDFQKGLNLITGVNLDNPERKNGTGKCVDESTEIDILISDPTALEKFKKMFPDY